MSSVTRTSLLAFLTLSGVVLAATIYFVIVTRGPQAKSITRRHVARNVSDEYIDVREFGATGDGLVDDTLAVQEAIDTAKVEGKAVFFPTGSYLVTKSLNCSFANAPYARLWLIGQAAGTSTLIGDLTEDYPIVDMTGNTRGGVRDLGIVARSGKATCCLYAAKPAAGGNLGNMIAVQSCRMELLANGIGSADRVAIMFFNSDLSYIRDSEIYGPTAFAGGFGKPASIRSKYQAPSDRLDSTMVRLDNCVLNAWVGPAVDFTGGASLSINDCYVAEIGAGSSSIIHVSGAGGKTVIAKNVRIENQSTFVGLCAFYFEGNSVGGEIIGSLETNEADFSVGVSGGDLSEYSFRILNTLGTMFKPGSVIKHVDVNTNSRRFGAVAPSSFDVTVRGDLSASEVLGLFDKAVYVVDSQRAYRKSTDVFVPAGATGVYGRYIGNIRCSGLSSSKYIGGSGEVKITEMSIPGHVLEQSHDDEAHRAAIVYEFFGIVGEGAQSRVRFVLRQGLRESTLLDAADIPGGRGGLRVQLNLLQYSGSGYFGVYSEGCFNGKTYNQYHDISNMDTGLPMVVEVYITSAKTDGVVVQYVSGRIM